MFAKPTAPSVLYSVFHPVSRKVLKIMFEKVPMAGGPLLWLASDQADPRSFNQQP